MRAYRVKSLGLVLLLGLLAACTASVSPPVTEQAARSLLASAVDRALARDFEGLCALSGSRYMCESFLRNGMLERAPTQPPRVVCVYTVAAWQSADGKTSSPGGQVLVVEGQDGKGERYATEVFVFHDGKRFVATNIVWWSNFGMGFPAPGETATTAPGPQTPDTRVQKCDP